MTSPSTPSGTTSSAAATTPTCRSGASWPRRAETASSTSAPAPGRVALRLAAAGHDVTALDLDPELLDVAERARRARPASTSPRSPPTPPTSRSPRPFGLIARADADDPAAARARRLLRRRPPRARARRPASRSRSPPTSSPTTARRRSPRPTSAQIDGWTYISQPIAIRVDDDRVAIERVRQRSAPTASASRPTT